MHGVWQQCCLVKPASMVGNRFVVLAILPGLHTSFHWAALAKAYKQLWKDFVVAILCVVHVADAFGSRWPLTTMKVMSTPLSKHLQEHVRKPYKRRCASQVDIFYPEILAVLRKMDFFNSHARL